MEYASCFQLKSMEHIEKLIEEGNTEIQIKNNIKIKPKCCFVNKKPHIDIYFGPIMEYSLERLNEILWVEYRTSLQEIVEYWNNEWEKAKKQGDEKRTQI